MRTDPAKRSAASARRPGQLPGRALAWALLLVVLATPAAGQEIFSWFNRGLLPVRFEAGEWVRYAVEEVDDYGAVLDTMTVTVLEADSDIVWLKLVTNGGTDYIALDPGRLVPGGEILDGLLHVVSEEESGLVAEDTQRLRESALVKRHFSDPFHQPHIDRYALADTVLAGHTLSREGIQLEEERRETAGNFVVITALEADAQLSSEIPLIGLLRSSTRTVVRTEAAEGTRAGRRRPPLVTRHELVCLDFGTGATDRLPDGIPSRD